MPIQRDDSDEEDLGQMPEILPPVKAKRTVTEAQLKALELGRAKKAELREQRTKERQESLVLAQQVKKIKDPEIKNTIKNEVIKANVVRQKKPTQEFPVPPPEIDEPDTPVQKTRKQPKIVLEDSEPEVIYVKVPKKKIVVQQSETESEAEPVKPVKPARAKPVRRPKAPVIETDDSESEYDPAPIRPPPSTTGSFASRMKPAARPVASGYPGFKINF